jgi:hypothetical protein
MAGHYWHPECIKKIIDEYCEAHPPTIDLIQEMTNMESDVE